jgi:hypothetical protein
VNLLETVFFINGAPDAMSGGPLVSCVSLRILQEVNVLQISGMLIYTKVSHTKILQMQVHIMTAHFPKHLVINTNTLATNWIHSNRDTKEFIE